MIHRPRKRFGQHFLHDPVIIAKILKAVDPKPGQTLVEIDRLLALAGTDKSKIVSSIIKAAAMAARLRISTVTSTAEPTATPSRTESSRPSSAAR